MNTTNAVIGVVAVALIGGGVYFFTSTPAVPAVTTFEACVAAGNPVMESYPRQCTSKDGTHFTENVGNTVEKADLIRVISPRPNEAVQSPLTITGEARGSWFFEASFPVVLTDWDGKIIAQGNANATGDWMTTDFVPFKATLTFVAGASTYSNKGTLILKKDNPSGLPENDNSLEIPVIVGSTTGGTVGGGILPYNSGIKGTVTLGPTCPVMKDPPDPQCADKGYATTISLYRKGSATVFATTKSDAGGMFQVSLPPGTYTISASGGQTLPRCTPTDAVVGATGYVTATISCDTGIR